MNTAHIFLILINILFFTKFAFQVSETCMLTVFLTIVYVCSFFFFLKMNAFLTGEIVISLISIWVFCMIALCVKYPVVSVDTDRWSAIAVFWNGLFQGDFPYAGRTVLGNIATSLPGLQLLCFPFYLTTYSLMTIVPLIPFLASAAKEKSILFFLIASPAIAWSVVTRDTITINSMFFLFAMWTLHNRKYCFVTGLMFGMLLCTRIVYLAPIVFLILQCRGKIVKMLSGIATGLFLFFAPLFFWGTDALLRDNPILAQSGHMPLHWEIMLFVLVILFGIVLRERGLQYHAQAFFIGIMLFIFAVIFQFNRVEFSWDSIMERHGDISYFLLCYPFFLASSFSKKEFNCEKCHTKPNKIVSIHL